MRDPCRIPEDKLAMSLPDGPLDRFKAETAISLARPRSASFAARFRELNGGASQAGAMDVGANLFVASPRRGASSASSGAEVGRPGRPLPLQEMAGALFRGRPERFPIASPI